MAVVHVAHVERGALAVEPAGAESGQFALMRKFRDRVGLVHELRKLRGTEKFADDRGDGAHVDEPRRRDLVGILRGHALFDEALEARDPHAQLILQKFADAPDAPIAEMVDIVDGADAVAEIEVGRYRRDHVVHRNVPVIEFVHERTDGLFLLVGDRNFGAAQNFMELFARRDEFDAVFPALFAVFAFFLLLVVRLLGLFREIDGVDLVAELLRDLFKVRVFRRGRDLFGEFEVGIINGRQKPETLGVFIGDRLEIDGIVADDPVAHFARALVGYEHVYGVDARILDLERLLFGDLLPFRDDQLARFGIEQIVRGNAPGKPVCDVQFFIEFISADLDHVVTAGIEKEVVQMLAHGLVGGDFAGAQTPVQFDQAVLLALCGILFDGCGDHLIVAENIGDGDVRPEAEGAQKDGRADLSFPVDVHPHDALRILFEFQPGAAVGDDRGFEHFPAGLVLFRLVIRAGRADQLRNDDALRAVNDKGAVLRHQREIAHKDVLIDDFFLHLIDKAHFYPKRHGIGRVAVAALFFVILGLVSEFVTEKIQFEMVGVVGNGREIFEHFAHALFDERAVRILLDLYEVRNVDDLIDLAEFPSLCLAVLLDR